MAMLTTTQLIAARLKHKIDNLEAELEALRHLQAVIGASIDIPHLERLLGEAKAKLQVIEMLDPQNN